MLMVHKIFMLTSVPISYINKNIHGVKTCREFNINSLGTIETMKVIKDLRNIAPSLPVNSLGCYRPSASHFRKAPGKAKCPGAACWVFFVKHQHGWSSSYFKRKLDYFTTTWFKEWIVIQYKIPFYLKLLHLTNYLFLVKCILVIIGLK